MLKKRSISFSLFLSLACTFLLYGCDIQPSSRSMNQNEYDIDGQWAGYTDQKQFLAFTIENHRLTHLEIVLWKESDCQDRELRRFSPENPIYIKGDSITTNVYEDTLTASFGSSIEASGTFDTYGGKYGDHGCLGNTTFHWNAIRQVLPDTTQCISIPTPTTTTVDSIEPSELQMVSNGLCVEINGTKNIKHSIGSRIAPSSLDLSSYWIWIPERELITTLNGKWVVVNGGAKLKYDEGRIWMPDNSMPVLEWDGEFYIAIMNFYEKIRE